jgi:hypothetical protein
MNQRGSEALDPHNSLAKAMDNHGEYSQHESPNGSSEVQSLFYQRVPLSQLDPSAAVSLCEALFSPEERFAKGFYHYWREVLNMSEAEAQQETLNELKTYSDRLKDDLSDPHYQTIGFNQQGKYTPVGLYGFRALKDHSVGAKLYQSIEENGLLEKYQGKLAIAHTFSALSDYRNRAMMKYAFLRIAFDALEDDFNHIFFFMSDHRLGPIYSRFGLEFPPNLTFPDSKHLVGCYSITREHLDDIRAVAEQFGESVPEVSHLS